MSERVRRPSKVRLTDPGAAQPRSRSELTMPRSTARSLSVLVAFMTMGATTAAGMGLAKQALAQMPPAQPYPAPYPAPAPAPAPAVPRGAYPPAEPAPYLPPPTPQPYTPGPSPAPAP